MPDAVTAVNVSNFVDFYKQQLLKSEAWFNLNTPLYNAIDKFEQINVSQRGVRMYFEKQEAGGHTLPTLSQPDFNRTKGPQGDSMYGYALMYALPLVIDIRTLMDAQKMKEAALFNVQTILKSYTGVAAKRQEYFVGGDGKGALAYSSSTLAATGSGQTMNGETAAAAAPGHTKGTGRLKAGQYYQAYDETTFLPRGTILVETEGASSTVVNVTSGSVTTGDPICDVGGYQKAPRGLTWLVSDTNRIIQGRDSSVDTVLNCPVVDKNGTKFTPSDRETQKTMLVVKNIEAGARAGLTFVTTPGLMSDLRKQQYGFRRNDGKEAATDVQGKYQDADGNTILEIPDFDEDRHIAFKNSSIKRLEEMKFGEISIDGLEWRNILGANSSGSILWQKAWGCIWSLINTDFRACSLIKRASLDGIVTQAGNNLF